MKQDHGDFDIGAECLRIMREVGRASPRTVARRLGVSECCVVYWLTELARQGRIRIVAVEPLAPGQMPCALESQVSCDVKAVCPIEPPPRKVAVGTVL